MKLGLSTRQGSGVGPYLVQPPLSACKTWEGGCHPQQNSQERLHTPNTQELQRVEKVIESQASLGSRVRRPQNHEDESSWRPVGPELS